MLILLVSFDDKRGDRVKETLAAYCRRTGRMDLLEEWEAAANLPHTPENTSYGSKFRAHWRCAQGHHWQTAVHNRTTTGSGCPVCSGRQVCAGFNDLATTQPALARQWHPAKNGSLTPQQFTAASHHKAWWRCEKGHEWQAEIKSRVQGAGCPVCAGRQVQPGENDLATRDPVLAAEWHPTKNGALTPRDVTPGSSRKVWWRCARGHEWQASIASRHRGNGCPVCSSRQVLAGFNDLASQFPQIAGEWHPTKNGVLTPEQVTPASNRKVWWRCPLGHDYQATVASRTRRHAGCPYCSGRKVLAGFNDLASQRPALAREWKQLLNGDLTPQDVTPASHKKVWWQCPAGHVWQATVYSRTHGGSGCPVCAGKAGSRRLAMQERLE